MTNHRPLFVATTAGIAALRTSVMVAMQLLNALIMTKAINHEVAIAILDDIERDARNSVTEAPELSQVLDLHFRSARQSLLAARPR